MKIHWCSETFKCYSSGLLKSEFNCKRNWVIPDFAGYSLGLKTVLLWAIDIQLRYSNRMDSLVTLWIQSFVSGTRDQLDKRNQFELRKAEKNKCIQLWTSASDTFNDDCNHWSKKSLFQNSWDYSYRLLVRVGCFLKGHFRFVWSSINSVPKHISSENQSLTRIIEKWPSVWDKFCRQWEEICLCDPCCDDLHRNNVFLWGCNMTMPGLIRIVLCANHQTTAFWTMQTTWTWTRVSSLPVVVENEYVVDDDDDGGGGETLW